jgi:hypothetical protein
MFRRRWKWIGKLVCDEGFELAYGHRSITYSDERGSFEFGLEDGLLFPTPKQVAGQPLHLGQPALEVIIERVLAGIRFEGHAVQVYSK